MGVITEFLELAFLGKTSVFPPNADWLARHFVYRPGFRICKTFSTKGCKFELTLENGNDSFDL